MDAVYNIIGTNYNSTRQADPHIAGRLLHFLNPDADGVYLDIGCGTGNYTIALANAGLNFAGIEPAEEMLRVARSRNNEILWVQGVAEQLTFDDDSFAGALATLTIHHWTDIAAAFKEVSRVLKPSARFVIFTALPEQMEAYWLNYYFPGMMQASIKYMPPLQTIDKCLTTAGFKITATEKYFVKDDLKDKFLYSGKNSPALYLDEAVRRGISSFATLADKAEVEKGLLKMKDDLKTGGFDAIKQYYDNQDGDYIFIAAKKITGE